MKKKSKAPKVVWAIYDNIFESIIASCATKKQVRELMLEHGGYKQELVKYVKAEK